METRHVQSLKKAPSHALHPRAPPSASASSADCKGPYNAPASGDTVTAYEETDITWNQDCLNDYDHIDIYLYDVSGDSTTPLHGWARVPVDQGSLTTKLYPSWWNATDASDREVQLQFIDSGDPRLSLFVWASTFSTGPIFTVHWNGTAPPAQVTKSGGSWNESVEAVTHPTQDSKLSSGQMAAAIVVPLLAAISAVVAYLVWNRRRSVSANKRWSKAIDHRVSMMSAAGDQWQPPQPRPGSVAYSLMQSKRASMAPSSMHRRTDSNDSAFSASPSWNAAGFGAAQRSPETSPQHDRSFSSGGQSSHVSKPSLSGEFMKELRASRISFNQSSSNSKRLSRPGNALQMPRLGQNGWRGSVVGDPFQDAEVIGGSPTSHWRQGHGASASMSSSLRNEYTAFGQPQSDVRDSIFSGDDISGAVSMIRDDQPASAISKKRQSQYSNSPSDSPPLAIASRADPRRISRHSGYFSNTPQQQHQLRESTYSEDSAYTQPNASASFFAASRSPLTQSPQGPNLTPDDALAAYTARQTAQQQQPSALTQSAVGGGGVKGLKAKGKMANLFKKNSQAPPDPTPLSPDSSSLSPSLQERA